MSSLKDLLNTSNKQWVQCKQFDQMTSAIKIHLISWVNSNTKPRWNQYSRIQKLWAHSLSKTCWTNQVDLYWLRRSRTTVHLGDILKTRIQMQINRTKNKRKLKLIYTLMQVFKLVNEENTNDSCLKGKNINLIL